MSQVVVHTDLLQGSEVFIKLKELDLVALNSLKLHAGVAVINSENIYVDLDRGVLAVWNLELYSPLVLWQAVFNFELFVKSTIEAVKDCTENFMVFSSCKELGVLGHEWLVVIHVKVGCPCFLFLFALLSECLVLTISTTGAMSVVSTLGPLLLTLVVSSGIDCCFSVCEFHTDFSQRWLASLHPRVRKYFL